MLTCVPLFNSILVFYGMPVFYGIPGIKILARYIYIDTGANKIPSYQFNTDMSASSI